jgi:spore maturation protein A
MINLIWACMIIIGIITAIITGNIDKVNEAIITSSEEAVSLCITMLGIVSMWSGIMNIAEKSGLM